MTLFEGGGLSVLLGNHLDVMRWSVVWVSWSGRAGLGGHVPLLVGGTGHDETLAKPVTSNEVVGSGSAGEVETIFGRVGGGA